MKKSLIKHFTRNGNNFTVLNYFQIKKHDDKRLSVRLFTDRHQYSISATIGGYLGCTYGNRKPLPGETWTRGRDLPDGPHSERTWGRIKSAILWEEFVPLSKEVVSRLELQGIDTNNQEAKELAQLRREQQGDEDNETETVEE